MILLISLVGNLCQTNGQITLKHEHNRLLTSIVLNDDERRLVACAWRAIGQSNRASGHAIA